MWTGVLPAVTTKFKEDGSLDQDEMARCFALQMDAGCDGLIVCGSLGEGSMLSQAERLEVLAVAKAVAADKPSLMTVAEAATRDACRLAEQSARAGADGLMVVPESHLPHRPARNGGDDQGSGRGGRPAGDDLLKPRCLSRRRHATTSWRDLADDARFVAIKEFIRRYSPHD